MPDPADTLLRRRAAAPATSSSRCSAQTARARRCTCQAACPRCGGTGYTLVPSGGSMVAQPCAAGTSTSGSASSTRSASRPRSRRRRSRRSRAGRPDHASARKAAAEDFARKFRRDAPTKGFLLYGRPGAGKTHLLVATLRYLALEKGVSGRYVEFMLLLSDIRSGFDANRSHMEILRPLLSVPVLAIDELGKERGTEWERSMLDELISRRFNSGLATLFATNYFLEARAPAEEPGRVVRTRSPDFQREAESMTLSQRVGDRIYSRLNEMCSFVKLDPGHDLRKDRHGSGSGGFWG